MPFRTMNEDAPLPHLKMLVYGGAGTGKSTLATTWPDPARVFVVDCEGGEHAYASSGVQHIRCSTFNAIRSALVEARTAIIEGAGDVLVIDSLSEAAEYCLAQELMNNKDPRRAYGELATKVTALVRFARDLPCHVLFSAKMQTKDDEGRLMRVPFLPGQQLTTNLPYLVDVVAAFRVEKQPDGQTVRWLQTEPDGVWAAKDRTGCLPRVVPVTTDTDDAWTLHDIVTTVCGEVG